MENNYKIIKNILTLLFIIFVISYFITFLINPGIPGREYSEINIKFPCEQEKQYYEKCYKCNIIIPKFFKVSHCKKCGVCVRKRDHHCPWTGKCIGYNNVKIFCIFGLSLFGYLIMLVVSLFTFLAYVQSKNKNKK